jgi:hypothetical protein
MERAEIRNYNSYYAALQKIVQAERKKSFAAIAGVLAVKPYTLRCLPAMYLPSYVITTPKDSFRLKDRMVSMVNAGKADFSGGTPVLPL